MHKKFKSPIKVNKVRSPKYPSPKLKNFRQMATKPDLTTQCTYIHPDFRKRCKNILGLYPEFCELHTMTINNLYIAPSQIKGAGNGLFVGSYGFKEDDILGEYSSKQNETRLGIAEKNCKGDKCWDYTLCDFGDSPNTKCWEGYDMRSTLMRNANDAYKSNFKNNAYFKIIKGRGYVIAGKKLKPHAEVFIDYGKQYW